MTGWDAGMAKRCYYEVLEVERTAERRRAEGRVPQARDAVASRPQSGRQGLRASASRKSTRPTTSSRTRDKRAAYDRFGHAAFEQGGGGAGGGFGADFGSAFSDIFDDLFGMGGARRGRGGGRERGADLRYNMEITLEEAYAGKTAQVRIPTSVTCEACSGSGAKAGTKPKACPHLRRPRPHPPRPGLLHARAHLPGLPGPRPGDRQSVPVLLRLRAA